jgi:hypothetical protein
VDGAVEASSPLVGDSRKIDPKSITLASPGTGAAVGPSVIFLEYSILTFT